MPSGGREGDTGVITGKNFEIEITDTKKVGSGKIAHIGTVKSGAVSVGDKATLAYDVKKNVWRRRATTLSRTCCTRRCATRSAYTLHRLVRPSIHSGCASTSLTTAQ